MKELDVLIIGGGITGTSYLYTLAKYTNIKNIGLIEMRSEYGDVNTHFNNNSQTLHAGDIETNYTLEKAKVVKAATDLLAMYMEKNAIHTFSKGQKMILAVGDEEVKALDKRFKEFQSLYPDLKRIERDEIALLEPHVVKGRNPNEKILALYTTGYTVNFKAVATSFVSEAKKITDKEISTHLNCGLKTIFRKGSDYIVTTTTGETFLAKTVVFATGAHSLMYAKQLGYGKHLTILPVAGSFYYAQDEKLLNGKVYTMQKEKLPFAAVHGDPEFDNENVTRFGPTAKVLPMFVRHSFKTVFDFLSTSVWTYEGLRANLKVISDKVLLNYMLKNLTYDIPFLGRFFFAKICQKIIPALSFWHIKYAKGTGGIRPQLLNILTGIMEMGDARVEGFRILFEITPSPGASVCLANAYHGVQRIISFLGDQFEFYQEEWNKDFDIAA